jgi:hypothetical protein
MYLQVVDNLEVARFYWLLRKGFRFNLDLIVINVVDTKLLFFLVNLKLLQISMFT